MERDRLCTEDADCTQGWLHTECYDGCYLPIRSIGRGPEIADALRRGNATECKQFKEKGCAPVRRECGPLRATSCVEGTCTF